MVRSVTALVLALLLGLAPVYSAASVVGCWCDDPHHDHTVAEEPTLDVSAGSDHSHGASKTTHHEHQSDSESHSDSEDSGSSVHAPSGHQCSCESADFPAQTPVALTPGNNSSKGSSWVGLIPAPMHNHVERADRNLAGDSKRVSLSAAPDLYILNQSFLI